MSGDRGASDTETLLAQVPLFAGLNRRELKELAALCLPKGFPAGAHLVDEGRRGLGLFILTAGRVEVYKGEGADKRVLSSRGPGSILGEMSVIDDQPRWATVVAVEPTRCLLITRDRFHALVKRHPGIAWSIVPVLTERFRTVEKRLLDVLEATAGGGAAAPSPPSPPQEERADEAEAAAESAGRPDMERSLDLLRVEYAWLLSGVEGLMRSAGIMETFLRALARETALADERKLERLLKALPEAVKVAAHEVLAEGERLPERMLATFRRELKRR